MKAVKIDVEKQDIYEIEFEGGLDAIYRIIGNGCDCFECPITFPSENNLGNGLYCDGEILFRVHDIKGGFQLDSWDSPIMNNAMIVGTDSDGYDVDHDIDILDLQTKINWIRVR
jgi:hypothetical protein